MITPWAYPTDIENVASANNDWVADVSFTADLASVDSSLVSSIIPSSEQTDFLKCQGFGLGALLPVGADPTGIELELQEWASTINFEHPAASPRILLNNSPSGTAKPTSPIPSSTTLVSYGGSGDIWGLSKLTRSDVSHPLFGIRIRLSEISAGGGGTVNLDMVRLRIHYSQGSGRVGGLGSLIIGKPPAPTIGMYCGGFLIG